MKTLFVVRHAKSSWNDSLLADHERPLNKRGKKAAPEMGRRLSKTGVAMDTIVSSNARRALDTAAAMARALGVKTSVIRTEPGLYHASADGILEIIYQLDDRLETVMMVGHNPGLTRLANRFLPQPIENIPTAGVVRLEFMTDTWRLIDGGNLTSSDFDYPKKK